jgi:hypothetical protein
MYMHLYTTISVESAVAMVSIRASLSCKSQFVRKNAHKVIIFRITISLSSDSTRGSWERSHNLSDRSCDPVILIIKVHH